MDKNLYYLQAASSSQDYTREASTSPDHIREASTSPDHTREASTSLDHTREEKPSPQILDGVEPREEGVTVTSFLSPRERTFKELYGCETENQEGMVEGSSFECDVDINDFDVRYTEDEMDTEENCAKRKLFFKDVKTEKSQSELNSLVKFTKSSFQDFADRGTVFQDYEMAGNQMMLDFAENSTKIMSKCLAISELSFNDSENGNSQNGLNSIEMSNKATFKCYECGHQFLQKSKIVSHLKTHTQEEHFECDECGQIFLESRLLKEHLLCVSAESTEGRFKCSYCNHTFLQDSNRKNHERVHGQSQTKLVPCCLCSLHFSDIKCVQRHARKVHSQVKEFKCLACGVKYSSFSHLQRHLKQVSMDYPYKCLICGHKYASVLSLKRHHSQHCKPKSFTCLYCLSTFSTKTHLQGHLSLQGKLNQYQCPGCRIEFFNFKDLKRHEKFYNRDRPFKCSECGHTFSTQGHLDGHQRIHTGEGWKCRLCGETFKKESYLKTHIQIHSEASYTFIETPNCAQYHEQGFYPLSIMQELRSIRFINSQNMYFHCQTHTLEHNQKEPEDNVMVGRNPSSCLEYNGMTCNQTSQLMQVSRQPIRDMTSCHHPHQECHDTESEPTDHIDVGRLDDTQAGDVFMQSNHCEMEERTQTVGSPEENGCCIEQKKVKPAESVCDNSPYVIFKPFPMQKMMTNFGSQEYDHQSQVSSNLRQYHKIECKECNSQISGASNFRGHMLLHTGDRPFECKLCKAKFVRKDNLGRHMIRTHSTRQKTHMSDDN
ncbi:zinc finger protein 420-like [Homarus americanus]|uniref:zinc finger protein 420-like n=1 Tax=Homarus americanus TaxID=6706 RepID=UPI001C44591E|nr:zinc finger protein 420-like [Homarus americanus]XP_042209695.1 zinc finger protein 420-like [Homarus americanus]XP_042209696.1 zinc finger protein 420-like [Homarus americanus]